MPVITSADSPTIEAHGITAHPLAVPSRGTGELAIWHLELPAGDPPKPHSVSHEEIFIVEEGDLVGDIDGVPFTAGPGDAVVVPAGVLFVLTPAGGAPAKVLVCTSAGITATMNGQVVRPPWAQ